MRVHLPKTAAKKIEFNEREFALALIRSKDDEVLEPIPIGFNPYENYVEIDDEYGFTEDEVKAVYRDFKHDMTWNWEDWRKRLKELLDKDEEGDLSDEEEKELKKLERKRLRHTMEGEVR